MGGSIVIHGAGFSLIPGKRNNRKSSPQVVGISYGKVLLLALVFSFFIRRL
ncbi:hypothetical protein QK356_17470 [Pseudomonas aeruginosa]|uniref:hypothetical protein n=1 Tax=Pseudomonas aeruginosa TaxID=287 RepID=UPI001F4A60EF|nr:hypothetical protein [Pseudomonas aeruginosa]MDI3753511.1 hypothetical protein [Pseudomonas aeruginosa]MDI3996643.1 hypothetical protein [Pseudomonas aeruginosa]HCF1752258.1 hypothetical protein [Pseudomonas aeruginosa]